MITRPWKALKAEIVFRRHQRALKALHLAKAEERFPVAVLVTEIADVESRIESEIAAEFAHVTARIGVQIEKAEARALRAELDLKLLQRNFKPEMQPVYDQLASIKSALDDAFGRKKQAYDALKSAKSSLNAWYSKSERSFFGNKGRQLPRRSIFGQNTNDRDFYKSKRDTASREIARRKREIDALKSERDELGLKLSLLKADRARAKSLRARGLSIKTVSAQLEDAGTLTIRLRNQADELAKRETKLRNQLKQQYRYIEKLAALEKEKRAKAEFITSFDSSFARRRRRMKYKKSLS